MRHSTGSPRSCFRRWREEEPGDRFGTMTLASAFCTRWRRVIWFLEVGYTIEDGVHIVETGRDQSRRYCGSRTNAVSCVDYLVVVVACIGGVLTEQRRQVLTNMLLAQSPSSPSLVTLFTYWIYDVTHYDVITIIIVLVCFVCNVSAVTSHLIYSLEVPS